MIPSDMVVEALSAEKSLPEVRGMVKVGLLMEKSLKVERKEGFAFNPLKIYH